MEGTWDGFQRISTATTGGGGIGVFRHGSKETNRTVTVNDTDPGKMYEVKAVTGNVMTAQSGKALAENGFDITIEKLYDGELFEIGLKE